MSNIERKRQCLKDIYYRRKANGLCTKCGKNNDTKFVLCTQCKADMKVYKRKYDDTEKAKDSQRLLGIRRRKTEKYKEWKRNYMRERYKNDVQFKLARLISDRLSKAAKKNTRLSGTLKYLGCSLQELKEHLSSKFTQGMSWDNHGEWHIDHIVPLASADLMNENDLRRVCHYTNLQPLWAADNIRKHDSIPEAGTK